VVTAVSNPDRSARPTTTDSERGEGRASTEVEDQAVRLLFGGVFQQVAAAVVEHADALSRPGPGVVLDHRAGAGQVRSCGSQP
jgi:hypothetical protein